MSERKIQEELEKEIAAGRRCMVFENVRCVQIVQIIVR